MRIEAECKYLVTEQTETEFPEARELEVILSSAGLGLHPLGTAVHKDRYYDDARLSLARAGFALRRRMGEGKFVATLKTLGEVRGALHVRGELEEEIPLDAATWDAWPNTIAETVRTVCDPRSLNAVMTLEVERASYQVTQGLQEVAVLSFDHVTAQRPRSEQVVAWREVEIEATPHAQEVSDTSTEEQHDLLVPIGNLVASLIPTEPTLETKLQRAQSKFRGTG